MPTYLREQMLVETVANALALDPSPDEILVIDQTPQHELQTEAFLREQESASRIRRIRLSPPNLPAARNLALAETGCEVLIFVDDDVRMPQDFVRLHLRNYTDADVGAVAGRVLQSGLRKPARKSWPPIMDHRFFPLDSMERRESVAVLRGCNHSVRTSVLRHIGGYDPNYIGWAWGEDGDVAVRIWKTGRRVVFDPLACLEHLAAPTGGCRMKINNRRLPEWKISFPATYFAFRHLFPTSWFWHDVLLVNFRKFVLRRENVLSPIRLPWALASYGFSILLAARLSLSKR
ncbi:MAG: glycosyltransferase family 2 protein [Bryobacterales bacterium]|nr:glycosyltransferase family 2 protein [Bryobacterales bacterium]